MDERPNCYKCIHRGTIPGDAHSCCHHPKTGTKPGDVVGNMVAMFSSGFPAAVKALGVTGDPVGMKHGWFMWPANFDPTWLLSCNGFELKGDPS